MTSTQGVVIVGAGQSGVQLALSLRARGYSETITLLGEEDHPPYLRPPLSKSYLLGKMSRSGLFIQTADALAKKKIEWLPNACVTKIDRKNQQVLLKDRGNLPYEKLVLATGARSRLLKIPGANAKGILSLRSLNEADALRKAMEKNHRCVIIGGGFIGLEFAAVARTSGNSVTVIESRSRLMSRVVSEQTAEFFQRLHETNGVRLITDAEITGFQANSSDEVTGVQMASGELVEATLVLIGIGAQANDQLAQECGLDTHNGVLVDKFLQTVDPSIYAIGDCVTMRRGDHFVRHESVQNAVDQAQHLSGIFTGDHKPYSALAWFWSDQFDSRLQIVGETAQADKTVTCGLVSDRNFSTFFFRDERLIGVESVNRPVEHALARKVLTENLALTPASIQGKFFSLKSWLETIN